MSDHPITTESEAELLASWAKVHDWPSRSTGQLPICWGSDNDTAVAMAHDRFRWFHGGWAVNADPSTPAGFEGASEQRFLDESSDALLENCGPHSQEQGIRWEGCVLAPPDEGGTMAQTTAVLYTILGAITVFGGVGFLIALISMAKYSSRD